MKYTGIILVLAIGFVACQSPDQKADKELVKYNSSTDNNSNVVTTLQWLDSTTQDLGKAIEGQILEVSYRFKNTGTQNLIIEDVHAGCGCTIPEKPEKPFAPGEEGVIRARFDSKDKPGSQTKNLTVKANTAQKDYVLYFKVEVSSPSK